MKTCFSVSFFIRPRDILLIPEGGWGKNTLFNLSLTPEFALSMAFRIFSIP
jgi:hypothetical protein